MIPLHPRLAGPLSLALSVALLCSGDRFEPVGRAVGTPAPAGEAADAVVDLDPATAVEAHPPAGEALAPADDDESMLGVTSIEASAPQPPRRSAPLSGLLPYRMTAYAIAAIDPDDLPHVGTGEPGKVPSGPQDANGIPMKQVGTRLYYSPAGLAQFGMRYEDAYRRTRDPDYLAIAGKVERKLIELGVTSNGGRYIPYGYDFNLHGMASETMHAPWYSAMAQGIALSLAVRLHRDTGDPSYMVDAAQLFATFRHVGRGPNPWVTYVDASRYLWLEEYPEPGRPSEHAANGFNFAIFGIYDYFEETHDPVSLRILRAGLTTMRHYIAQYRIPGSVSRYCLRHGVPEKKYHRIVTGQLMTLYRISGDAYFLAEARAFAKDFS